MNQVIDSDFIQKNSSDHLSWNNQSGKRIVLTNNKITFSIVGGRDGLYGDFINNFEVAVFDNKTNFFITKYYFPEISDDVVYYLPLDRLLDILNLVFKNGFRVP